MINGTAETFEVIKRFKPFAFLQEPMTFGKDNSTQSSRAVIALGNVLIIKLIL